MQPENVQNVQNVLDVLNISAVTLMSFTILNSKLNYSKSIEIEPLH